jgi:hypothetical protein
VGEYDCRIVAELTTVKIPEDVWEAAKRKALDDRATLQSVIETILRAALNVPAQAKAEG